MISVQPPPTPITQLRLCLTDEQDSVGLPDKLRRWILAIEVPCRHPLGTRHSHREGSLYRWKGTFSA